jgi:hypothetical protein
MFSLQFWCLWLARQENPGHGQEEGHKNSGGQGEKIYQEKLKE